MPAAPVPAAPAPMTVTPAPVAVVPMPVPADLFRLEALHLALATHGRTGSSIARRQLSAFCQRLRRQRRGLGAGSQRGGSGRKSKGDFQKMTAFHDISLLAGIPQMTPELAWIFSIFLAPCKAKAQFGTATATSGSPDGGRGADLAIFAGIWAHSSLGCS